MEARKTYHEKTIRLILFLVVAAFHAVLLFLIVFPAAEKFADKEPEAGIFKLVDVEEELPPPPPPVREPPPQTITNTVEAVAETIIETDEIPLETVVAEPLPAPVPVQEAVPEFLPMGRIADPPKLPEAEIRDAMVYPLIAQRAGLGGIAYLELFIDAQGVIRNVALLREEPEGRGFGEAALAAIKKIQADGAKAIPATADGKNVGVRFRYPIRFALR